MTEAEPRVRRYPTEIFGFPFTNTKDTVTKARKRQECPFLKAECKKPRKSQPKVKIGVCSVGYKGGFLDDFKPVIICPYRFNVNSVRAALAASYFDNPKAVKWASEVPLGMAGSVDYVGFETGNDGHITNFVCVEFQAAGTVGTPWKAVLEFRKHGSFLHDGYDYGINWANEFLKTMMQQAYKKGLIIESWNEKLIFVIQDVALAYLRSACDAGGLREASDKDPIHFYTFRMEWNTKHGEWLLVPSERVSTNAEGIRQMLSGTAAEQFPTLDEFKSHIARRLSKQR